MRRVIPGQLELDLSAPAEELEPAAARSLTASDDIGMIEKPVRDKRYRFTALGRVVSDYLTWKEIEDGAAARTLDQYERDLARLCLHHPRLELEGLTADEYRIVIASFPPRSRKRATAVFRDFSRWLYQKGRIEHDVSWAASATRGRSVSRRSTSSAKRSASVSSNNPDRDRLLIRLLLEAGLRKGEARRLQLRDVDVEQSRLVILEGKGGKDRVIPIAPDLVEELLGLAIRDGISPDDHLWYATRVNQASTTLHRERPIGEATFARWWRTCSERARVSYRNPHVCRHTFATRWLRDGGRMDTLAKALGHSSIRTTVDLYAHLATEDVAAGLARVMAARESRLRNQSAPQTRMDKREEAPSGFEPLYEALQASA